MSKGAKIGCGCLVVIIGFIGVMAALFVFVFGALKKSDAYVTALAAAEASPQVVEVIGTPIKPGLVPSGSISLENDGGEADLTFEISGPKGSGTVHVVGTRSAGSWTYSVLEFTSEDGATVVDMQPGAGALPSPEPEPAPAPAPAPE